MPLFESMGTSATFLAATPGVDLCDACLAWELGLTVQETEQATAALAVFPDFLRVSSACALCDAPTVVTRALHVFAARRVVTQERLTD